MANGKGSRRRPLSRCTDQELAAEWNRIFGRKARPANRRSVINRLTAAGNRPRPTPEEFAEHRRAFMATQPDLGIDRDAERTLAECSPYEVTRKEINGQEVTVLTAEDHIMGVDLAKPGSTDKSFRVTRIGDQITSIEELPPSPVPAAETAPPAPAIVVAPKPEARRFRKYGRQK